MRKRQGMVWFMVVLVSALVACGKVKKDTNTVKTVARYAGYTGTVDGVGTAARFDYPYGITTDGTYLYVADTGNNTIRKIVISTKVVTTLAGVAGAVGTSDGIGTAARFNYPTRIATHGGYVYVADTDSHAIRKIVISSGVVTTLAGKAAMAGSADGAGSGVESAGNTDATGSAASFNYPTGLTVLGDYLYVADAGNSTIRSVKL